MSDLWVLVQEPSSSVAAPVEALGDRLQRETFIEFAVMLAVLLILWFVVFRPRQFAGRGPKGNGTASATQSSMPSTLGE